MPDDRTLSTSAGQELTEGEAPKEASVSRTFTIHSLSPSYDPRSHELYVRYLRAELDKPARKPKKGAPVDDQTDDDIDLRPRNIALTGSYGSGKSSILSKVVEDLDKRAVSVSLSTLGTESRSDDAPASPKSPTSAAVQMAPITNAIQKEVVKQLLYREKPSNVPGSRYRRIESFRSGRATGFSLLIASALTAVALLTHAPVNVEAIFGNKLGPDIVIYIALFILLAAGSLAVQSLFHNRVWIEKLSSGPASISLTDKSESFFDRYLDEIVYFFEANDYDVVVFEDLDRFNDPYIFETLRELNTLLNNSKQIDPKTITFVYAMKDSIFGQLRELEINGAKLTEDEVRRLAVTNRTKFFDVVIPVVPFISHSNARDLIRKEMSSSGFVIPKPLLDLVAKHLVDMRLIKNIHNEFGIFEQKVLAPGHLDELKPQPLFAMVVYKNLNMIDFEKVNDGHSKLDDVYADFRKLVNAQITSADRSIRPATVARRKLEMADERATEFGDRLEEYLARLVRSAGSTIEATALTLGAAVTLPQLRERAFWEGWLGDESKQLVASYPRVVNSPWGQHNTTLTYSVSLADLRTQFGDPFTEDEWGEAQARALQKTIDEATELRDFLKSATMQQMVQRVDLALETSHGDEPFAKTVERHLGDGLAADLLKAGYIDRNFSLYVSLYYDDTVTAQARNYILHSVETGTVDINAQIGNVDQVDALVEEVGDSIFGDRSIYNIQLLDRLLGTGEPRLTQSMRLLAGEEESDLAIREAYFSNGLELTAFVSRLTPFWPAVLNFLVLDDVVPGERRLELLDVALASVSEDILYDSSSELRDFLHANYREMRSLTGGRSLGSLDALVKVLKETNVDFESLKPLSPQLRARAVENSLYELSKENLSDALGGEENLALNTILAIDENVFEYVADNLEDYLAIQRMSVDTKFTISDHSAFISTVNKLAGRKQADLLAVVQGSSSVRILAIESLNEAIWPLVAQTKKLQASYANVSAYIAKRGAIDEELAVTLQSASLIENLDEIDQLKRRTLALSLLKTDLLGWAKRVQLAKSLELDDPIPVADLELESNPPQLTGGVIENKLIEDSAASFNALAVASWDVKSAYIEHSPTFSTYVDSVTLTKPELTSLAKDPATPKDVMQAIVLNLEDFKHSTNPAALNALADFAIGQATAIGASNLLVMAQAGVNESALVRLIDLEIKSIGDSDLLEILRSMPERYKKLTTTNGSTKIPNTPENVRLVDRLKAMKQISSREPFPKGPLLRVNLKKDVK